MKVGDKVRFLDSVGGGVVRRIDEARGLAFVEDEAGFEIPTVFAQCVVVASSENSDTYRQRSMMALRKGPSEMQMKAKQVAEHSKPSLAANGKKEAKQPDEMVVDLHMEALLPGNTSVPPEEVLQYQLRTFRRVMTEQRKYRGKRVVFVHGKGEGVLKREIQNILKREFASCSFLEASYQRFSSGATMVLMN